MNNYDIKKREEFICNLESIVKGNEIYVWGGGKHTSDFLDIIEESKLATKIMGIVDSDENKKGKSIKGILIHDKNEFFNELYKECSDVIISSTYEEEIYCEINSNLREDLNVIKLHNEKLWYRVFGNPWGSRSWFEEQFENTDELGDKWGIRWRASQEIRHEACLNIIQPCIKIGENRVLDIGCAFGEFTKKIQLLNRNNKIYAIDISHNAIREDIKKYKNIKFEQGALPNLNYESDSFDFITCLEVLYYLDDKKRIESLKNIKRILKKQGKFFISVVINSTERYFEEKVILDLMSKYYKILKVDYNYAYLYNKVEPKFLNITNKCSISSIKYKLAYLFLRQVWIAEMFRFFSKFIYKNKAKTHILILAERTD